MAETSLFTEFAPHTKEAWIEQATKDLKGADLERKLFWPLEQDIAVAPFYTSEDLDSLAEPQTQQNLALNHTETPLAPRDWEIREYLAVTNPHEANHQALDALNQGATGLVFDLTEVGVVDLSVLLKDINPAYCGISFRTSNSAFAIMKLYRDWLRENEVDLSKVTGQLGFDPISRWMVSGEMEDSCFDQVRDVFDLVEDLPNFRSFLVSGKPVKNAGGSISQEIGTILSLTVAYIEKLQKHEIPTERIFQHLVIETAVSGSYFPEIAKYRALRYLISRLAEVYGLQTYHPSQVYLSAQSALWNKTIFDPYVNILRNTTEAMSAVLGGVNALALLPHDQAFRHSDAFSRRIARNVSNILREESHLDKVVDAAAGSYFLENLTQSYLTEGWAFFQAVEEQGGIIEAFKKGWVQEHISEVRSKTERKVFARSAKLVGVNDHPNAKEKVDPDAITLPDYRTKEGTAFPLLPRFRAAEAFENLRLDTERFVKRNGNDQRPKVFLALVGDKVMRKARATFSSGFFGVAGFSVLPEKMYESWPDAAQEAADSEANIVVLCGSDDNYADFGEGFAELFTRKSKDKLLVLAGCPQACLEDLSTAGFQFFISAQTNAVEMLRSFQKRLQIIKS